MASVSALVTVGIVAFNHAEFIVDALESTLREESCRVIVADDASTDGTQGVVRKWLLGLSDQDAMRFTLVFNDDNVGLNATLNLVFAEVTTPYFVYLAGDDWHLEGRLSRQVELMESTGAVLSYGNALRANRDGQFFREDFYQRHPLWRARVGSEDPVRVLLEQGNWIAAPTVMFRADTLRHIGAFDESIAYEDFDTYVRMAHAGDLVFVEGDALAVHRELDSSLGVQIFRPNSLRWIESIARTELKMLAARPDLAEGVAERTYVRVLQASKVGANRRWVTKSMKTLRPYLKGRSRRTWILHRVIVGFRGS